jgi:hypothetical protein
VTCRWQLLHPRVGREASRGRTYVPNVSASTPVRRQRITMHRYECKEGEPGKFTLVFRTFETAIAFGSTVHTALLRTDWPADVLSLSECAEEPSPTGRTLFRGLRVKVGIAFGQAASRKPLSSGRAGTALRHASSMGFWLQPLSLRANYLLCRLLRVAAKSRGTNHECRKPGPNALRAHKRTRCGMESRPSSVGTAARCTVLFTGRCVTSHNRPMLPSWRAATCAACGGGSIGSGGATVSA